MKKFILSVLALGLCAGAVNAQELSKEEQKAIKEQQKAISALLKEAEKASKLSEDAMGMVDFTKVPDFATARAKVAEAFANPQAKTMLGDINRVAANIEYNESKIVIKGAQEGDQAALNTLFDNCGNGYGYYQAAWEAYATPDAKGKTVNKYNEDMANKASELFTMSNGIANCGFTAYQQENWQSAGKFFELAALAPESDLINAALKTNPTLMVEIDKYRNDSVKYTNMLYAGSCYSNVDKQKSLQVFKSLIGKNTPQNAVYQSIISEYAQLKDTTEMINWLQQGLEAFPSDPFFSSNLYTIYVDRNDLDGAIAAMKSSLASNPNNSGTYAMIARLYLAKAAGKKYENAEGDVIATIKNDYAPAGENYAKAVELDPENLTANLWYGIYFLSYDETIVGQMYKQKAREAEIEAFSNENLKSAMPYLKKAYQLDVNHEDSDIPTYYMNVLYRTFSPSTCPAALKAELRAEYEDVKAAYGR